MIDDSIEKVNKIRQLLNKKNYKILDSINITIGYESGLRGVCILPGDYDPLDANKQLPFYLSNDYNAHMFCLNYESNKNFRYLLLYLKLI